MSSFFYIASSFIAILDANVLFPASLRDTLLRAYEKGLYTMQCTEEILEEVQRDHRETSKRPSKTTKNCVRTPQRAGSTCPQFCQPYKSIYSVRYLLLNRQLIEYGFRYALNDKHNWTPEPGQVDHLFAFQHGLIDALTHFARAGKQQTFTH